MISKEADFTPNCCVIDYFKIDPTSENVVPYMVQLVTAMQLVSGSSPEWFAEIGMIKTFYPKFEAIHPALIEIHGSGAYELISSIEEIKESLRFDSRDGYVVQKDQDKVDEIYWGIVNVLRQIDEAEGGGSGTLYILTHWWADEEHRAYISFSEVDIEKQILPTDGWRTFVFKVSNIEQAEQVVNDMLGKYRCEGTNWYDFDMETVSEILSKIGRVLDKKGILHGEIPHRDAAEVR